MTPVFLFLRMVLCLLFTACANGAGANGQGPKTPPELVAKTVVWQVHWDQVAGVSSTIPANLTFKMHKQSEAWISGLDWIISFAYKENQPFPNYVQRLPGLPDEVRRSALQPFVTVPKLAATIPSYTNSFQKLSAQKRDVREKLLDAFKQKACSTHALGTYKDDAERPLKRVRFWIAPVDPHFPVILYCVEGVPQIARVYFSTRTLKPLYWEPKYIGDEGTEPREEGLKLIQGIRAEGDVFELTDGRLVPRRR